MDFIRNASFSASSLKPIRPWSGFFQTASFRQPSNWAEVQSRFQHNLKYFQTNYLIVLACLLGFCLYMKLLIINLRSLNRLSNIFFLLGFVASGAALYFISQLPEDFSQNVQGIEVKPKHLQLVWAICTYQFIIHSISLN